MWFDINKSWSCNCLFNFIIGPRGPGKTFGLTKKAIENFINKGEQFMYIRRFKTELEDNKLFFDAIKAEGLFSDHTFEVQGKNYLIDGKKAGTCMALSTSKIKKSTSYPNITLLIFDEFLIDNTGSYHYLPNEVNYVFDIYKTVARKRPNVRMYFLANAISVTNPYFLKLKIELPYGTLLAKKKNPALSARGLVNGSLIELLHDQEFIDSENDLAITDLMQETDYKAYSVDNKFLLDNNRFIQKKNQYAQHVFIMKYKGSTLGVWVDYQNGLMFVSEDYDPYCSLIYAVTTDEQEPNVMLMIRSQRPATFKRFLEYYQQGIVRYENQNVKNLTRDIIRLVF